MKILITGATGTLGKHVIPALLREGHTLVHLGRSALPLDHENLSWILADFQRLELLDQGLFSGVDLILHMANMTKEDPALDLRLAEFLFQGAAAHAVPSFFYASSIRVYGHRLGTIDEDSAPDPSAHDPYGQNKLATELLLRRLAQNTPTKLRLLRIGHVLTPENLAKAPQRLGLASLLLWGRGFPHYIPVSDTLSALLFLVEKHRSLDYSVFHLTREDETCRYLDFHLNSAPFWKRALVRACALPLPLSFLFLRSTPGARESRCALILSRHLYTQGWKPGEASAINAWGST